MATGIFATLENHETRIKAAETTIATIQQQQPANGTQAEIDATNAALKAVTDDVAALKISVGSPDAQA